MSTIDETQEPTLRHGDESMDGWVEYLRDLLASWQGAAGAQPIASGESFDDETLAAVQWFQSGKQLLVDGIVGNQTWAALRNEEPQPIGTDGREPGTFVESGPEARWYNEESSLGYDTSSGGVYLVGFNTGAEPLDDQNFLAEIWGSTGGDWELIEDTRFIADGGVAAMPGERLFVWFEAPEDRFPGNEMTVWAKMDDTLGGDIVEDTVDLAARPDGPGGGKQIEEVQTPLVHFAGGEIGFTPLPEVGQPVEVWWNEINDGAQHDGPFLTEIRWVDHNGDPVGDTEFIEFEFDALEPGRAVDRLVELPPPHEDRQGHRIEIYLDRTTYGDGDANYSEGFNKSFHNVNPTD